MDEPIERARVAVVTPPHPLRAEGERIASLEAKVQAHDKDIERVLEAVNDHLRFCRTDLENRKRDRHELRNELTGIIGELRKEVDEGFGNVNQLIGAVRATGDADRSRFLWWVIGTGGAVILILLGVIAWSVPKAIEPVPPPTFNAPYVPGGIGAQ
jgi:hypothetical protein